jgi:nicotinate-nucleotide adenylyltransferase
MAKLCFGGSFNPIHHGHLICARAVAEARGFERVVLVPSGQPPHKPDDPAIAKSVHRLEMCRLAISGDPLFEVDDLELARTGPSYTIDTVREYRRRGSEKVAWLIGADMLAILPQWHEPEALLAEAELLIMARPGWDFDWDRLPPSYQRLKSNMVEAPRLDISATDIRERVARELSIRYLTPAAVCDYIRAHALYRDR